MKLLSNYFPFLLLSLLVYGFFFYQHQQPVIVTPPAFNSGQQSVQLQFVELSETSVEPVEEVSEPTSSAVIEQDVTIENLEEQLVEVENTKAEQQDIFQAITEAIEFEPVIQESKSNELALESIDSKDPKEIKVAQQQLQKMIQETTAASAASLRGELYDADFYLDLPAPPRPVRAKKKKSPAAADGKQLKTLLSEQSLSSKILQQNEKIKAKRILKKQPSSAINSAENQGVLQEAIVISINKPSYPIRAQKRNQQGRVVVKITVTDQGDAKNPEIISSSGYPILDNAVLDFIGKERFMPAHKGEDKITSEQQFSFRFELR